MPRSAISSETVQLWRDRVALDAAGPPALDDFEEELATPTSTSPKTCRLEDLVGGAVTKQVPSVSRASSTHLDAPGPAFYYLHVMLPHQPWKFHATASSTTTRIRSGCPSPDADRSYTYSWNDWSAAVAEQRHLLQAEYTDRLSVRSSTPYVGRASTTILSSS